MNPLRKNKIAGIFQDLEKNTYDSQGYEMETPSEEVYQALRHFLCRIPDGLFEILSAGDVERLQGGDIIIALNDSTNLSNLCIVLGKDFANFFYVDYAQKVESMEETNSVENLLENINFITYSNLFIGKLNKCKAPLPMYPQNFSHVL